MLVHMGFAVWEYSNNETFQSQCIPNVEEFYEYFRDATEYDSMQVIPRLLKRNVFPMFFCFVCLLALLVYEYLGSWIVRKVLSGTVGTVFSVILFPFKKCFHICCGRR